MGFKLSAFADEINDSLDIQMQVIKKYNIGYIEIRGVDGKNVSEYSLDEMKVIKKRLDDKNIKISAVGSPIGKIKITDTFDEHLELFKKVLETAKILETKYIRLFSFFMPKDSDPAMHRDEVLKRIGSFAQAAAGSGITLLHENEKEIYGDTAIRCLDIIESIGSDILKVTFDPANFVQCGEATYPYAYNMLKKYIEYVHIKDALENGSVVPAGEGEGHVAHILAELKNTGYNGFLSLEPHLGNFSGLAALENDADYMDLPEAGERTFALAANSLNRILNNL